MIEAFAETVHELKTEGQTTIFLSSHVLSEVERLCDRVGIIRRGAWYARRRSRIFDGRRRAGCASSSMARRPSRRRGLRRAPPAGTAADGISSGAGPWRRARGHARARVADIEIEPFRLEDYVLKIYSDAAGARVMILDRARPPLAGTAPLLLVAGLTVLLVRFSVSARPHRAEPPTAKGSSAARRAGASVHPGSLGRRLFASFGGTVALGFFHPVVMLSLSCAAIYMASEPAGEVDEGLVDLVVARPVPRHLMVTRSAICLRRRDTALIVPADVSDQPRRRCGGSRLRGDGAVPAARFGGSRRTSSPWSGASARRRSRSAARLRRRADRGRCGRAWPRYSCTCCTLPRRPGHPLRPSRRFSPFHYYEAHAHADGRWHTPARDIVAAAGR